MWVVLKMGLVLVHGAVVRQDLYTTLHSFGLYYSELDCTLL